MTGRITSSIDGLGSAIGDVGSALEGIHSQLGAMAKADAEHHAQVSRRSANQTDRELKVIEMLNNIQRRRRPLVPDLRDTIGRMGT